MFAGVGATMGTAVATSIVVGVSSAIKSDAVVGTAVALTVAALFPPNMLIMLAPATTIITMGMSHCPTPAVRLRAVAVCAWLGVAVGGNEGMRAGAGGAGLGAWVGLGAVAGAGFGLGRDGADGLGVRGTCSPVV